MTTGASGDPDGADRGARAAPLPPELAVLVGHGLDRTVLLRAAELSRRWQVSGDEALIASGLAPAEAVYRALAEAKGLPFLSAVPPLHPLARFPEAVLGGIAPLAATDRWSFVYAPRGPAFVRFAGLPPGRPPGFALCTPDGLRLATFAARGEHIARQAAESLPRERPDDSFYDGITLGQLAWTAVGALLLAFVAVGVGGSVRHGAMLLVGLPFLGLATIKVAAALERVAPPGAASPRLPDADLPVYTVLVPLFRESRVLRKLMAALSALDYPAAKLDAKLLIEEGDGETAAALARLPLPGFVEVVTVPPGQPRTKPRALNVGLALARGHYLVVYDAEDVPEPGQLRDAVAAFARAAPDVACLQARLVIDNADDNHLTRFFAVEYGGLFDVVNPALPRFDLPMPLGGTSNHLRTEVVRALGGWDPWNVTEDADLAVRLSMAGHRIEDLPSSTLEEAPATLRAWLAQRTRWMKGFAQTTITHSRRPIRNLGRLGPVRLFGIAGLVFGAVASAVVYPAFTAILVLDVLRGDLLPGEGIVDHVTTGLAATLVLAGTLAMILPGLLAIGRRRWGLRLVPYALLMPAYYLLVSLAAWRSLWELALAPDRWNKTEHGLARTSLVLPPAANAP